MSNWGWARAGSAERRTIVSGFESLSAFPPEKKEDEADS